MYCNEMTLTGPSDAELERVARQLALPELGLTGQHKLHSARVCIVGAGGLGSPVISYLAASGVGALTIIDDDVVELSNLHRQVIHGMDELGQPKTLSASRVASRVAPECEITQVRERLTAENASALLRGCDVIVDGSDSFDTRFAVDAAADALSIPVVWGAVLGWNAQVTVFAHSAESDSASATGLTALFPDDERTRSTPNCRTAGVIGALCGQAGSVMALEVIKLITGLGKPLIGRIMVIDALHAETRTVHLSQAPVHVEQPQGLNPLSEIPEGSLVVDVRFAAERELKPGIPDSVHVPLERILELVPGVPNSLANLGAINSAAAIVTVCAEGPRSIRAARHLAAAGFPVAGFLDGGLT
jgi:molybdopterin/thiamine biosynthesis adenylyltransferase/rhodanese-related sulfurtransferase